MEEIRGGNRKETLNEIHEVLTDGLQRELHPDENKLITEWTATFDHEERATIINMLKELLNKHKRHD
ncbi:hypothetical protein [Bacillus sp. SG-1]|uniref:hypothetical protein n=1 Tax=Bacillus sp. SG-1 TaxID=161544 RepID=UPI00015444EE|nr:hypothetical protein [Bacillus sp. SG-1]EDL65210.1 hypothetical protein BSG1_11551 [Bacillus sp. SG-1]